MNKLILIASVLVSQFAFAGEKFCGVVEVYGVQSYVYAKVIDGKFNAQITGDTKDYNKVVKLIKDSNCYCVEGTVTPYEFYESDTAEEPSVAFDFSKVTGLYTCNNQKKIK